MANTTVKYDWYQTDSSVTVTVLLKNAADKNYSVALQEREVLLKADGIEPIAITLCDGINVEQSSHKATPSKVEIKLTKLAGHRWQSLEKQEAVVPVVAGASGVGRKKPNWDKMAKEAEKQEAEERDGATDAFQQIFADANDDVKKAMMKSFYESGGTVLSTDWSEVGSKTVEVKPPEGCEFKKWD